MAEFFGDIERALADLYPYRWPLTFGFLLVATAVAAYGYRKGWHLLVWQHRRAVVIVGTPALAAVVVAGWYLGSPLFTSKTVIEEFPFSVNAEVPFGMTQTAAEETMEAMAKFSQNISEAMPVSMVTQRTAAVKIKSGSFRDTDGFHKGSGQAIIYRSPDGSHLLRLENLKVTNGPDLHVILTPHSGPDRRPEVKADGYADLGKLKGNKGDQNYPIPGDVDVDAQRSVVIYCEPFSVVFSVAMLKDEEVFAFAADAEVPPDMTRAGVERIMAGMAKLDQEVSEAMSDAMPAEMAGDVMAKAGMALTKGGMAMVRLGMEASDDPIVNQGVVAMEEGVAMMQETMEKSAMPTVEESMTVIKEGTEKSDEAMVKKGSEMMGQVMEEAADTMKAQPAAVRLKVGNLRDADSFHRGSGEATIYRGPDGSLLLRLENLNVTNGPALHVILTPHEDPKRDGDVKTTGYIDLGKLKGNKGNQNYPIPEGVDINAQRTLVIYCVPFKVVFSTAPLQDVS